MAIAGEKKLFEIDGQPVYLFTLSNGRSEVRISNYGCILLSWIVKAPGGREQDIVLGFDSVEEYLDAHYLGNCPYFGAVVGRYASRIKDARFRLDDEVYQLSMNAGLDHLHGGNRGLDRVVWEPETVDSKENLLFFHYTSPDGAEGYPGNLDLGFSFRLTEENQLILEMTGATDRPTPLNLTHHDYFNLNGGRGNIEDHWLRIPARVYLEQDENLVTTGGLVSVEGGFHDFREGKPVGLHLHEVGEYDQSFVLEKAPGDFSLAAVLSSRESGLKLEVHTTEPICHLYTGKWIPQLLGKQGLSYGPFSGLCLETMQHPNAVNIPTFPNTILRPGEIYRHTTVYSLGLEDRSARYL